MAPDNQEKSTGKLNDNGYPKRDQPLFASRRSRPTLQQPPDFLTESVNTSRNTSFIPSPSPEKSPTRESLRAKPRQAFDRRSSNGGSSKTVGKNNDENRPPRSSQSPWLRDRSKQGLKPSPKETARHALSKSPAKIRSLSKSPARHTTPSPSRGRTLVPESPANSESSPGRGYAEAYQRIVEEENLAQEDSIDDMDLEDLPYSQGDISQEIDRPQTKHRHSSNSSKSVRTSRKASPSVSMGTEPGDEKMEQKDGAVDQESVSDIAPTENDTQNSTGSGSSQYARDMQRLNTVLKGSGQVFSKARTGSKVGLTNRNLGRSNGSTESLGSARSSGSLSHQGSDPSVNVPKAWGRKSKPGNDWLSRISSRSGKFTGDPPKKSPSGDQLIAETTKRHSVEPVDQWLAAGEKPQLKSSPLTNGSSQGSTPRTSIQRDTPFEDKSKWDFVEDEFTGRSLQVSESPPFRLRNATLDSMRDQEIETLEKRAVTTSRLGELRERDSNRQLLPFEIDKGSANGSSPDLLRYDKEDAGEKTRRESDSSEVFQEHSPEKLGEPIPDTPIIVYRNESANSAKKSREGSQSSNRPQSHRGESDSLLKRLARVSSESPSPARDKMEAGGQAKDHDEKLKSKETPQHPRPKISEKTPVITGAWVEPSPGPIPEIYEPGTVLKTPLVMGRWIDTPLPTGGRGPPMPTPSDPEDNRELGSNKLGAADLITKLSTSTPRPQLRSQEPLKYTGPPLPKSALEEIINDARSGKLNDSRPDLDSAEEPTLHLGESTIQSLEDLVANDTDFSTILATSAETSPPTSDPSPSSSNQLSKSQEAHQDPQSYTQLLSRLTNLAPSIRASRRQIASLEQNVAKTTRQPNNETECNEAGEFHDFIWPCPRCHCPGRLPPLNTHSDLTTTINITVPRLWSWQAHDWRPRLTWLGTVLFCVYACCFVENWAQNTYCHPTYAYSMVGYGVDINAPRPPFVLFKVLYKKMALENLLGPMYIIARTIARLLAGLAGYLVGFMSGEDGGGGGTGGGANVPQPVSRDQRIPRPVWGPDLSMLDDEYL